MWVCEKALHVGDEASTSLKRWDLWTEVAPLSSERTEKIWQNMRSTQRAAS